MRVIRSDRPEGTTYRIYRASESFGAEIKALIPLLLELRRWVLVGDSMDDPSLVLTIEPLPESAAQEFLKRVGPHLAGA